jgi:hypothetical protein
MSKKFVAVMIVGAFFFMLASVTRASDVFIIHRPTLDIWVSGAEITAIYFDDTMYPIACDGYEPGKKFPCVVMGKNDSIPEFLQFLADNGEVMEMPRMWGKGSEVYNI